MAGTPMGPLPPPQCRSVDSSVSLESGDEQCNVVCTLRTAGRMRVSEPITWRRHHLGGKRFCVPKSESDVLASISELDVFRLTHMMRREPQAREHPRVLLPHHNRPGEGRLGVSGQVRDLLISCSPWPPMAYPTQNVHGSQAEHQNLFPPHPSLPPSLPSP